MGLYGDRILPRLINKVCGCAEIVPQRRRVCSALSGAVVEIGFGSGLNVPYYPRVVTRVDAVEPADTAWRLAASRIAATDVPIVRAGLDGQSLPFPDESHDTALSTWTLCTIPDPVQALRELRRVLRPDGTLHFLEHGLAPDQRVRRVQRAVEPLQKLLAGGCHLTRPIADLITEAGFTLTTVESFYHPGMPKYSGAVTLGTARPAP